MAYDEAKAKAMRGDSEPEDPKEESEGEGEGAPSEAEIAACRRVIAAIKANDPRALCAALKDVDDEPEEE